MAPEALTKGAVAAALICPGLRALKVTFFPRGGSPIGQAWNPHMAGCHKFLATS